MHRSKNIERSYVMRALKKINSSPICLVWSIWFEPIKQHDLIASVSPMFEYDANQNQNHRPQDTDLSR